MDLDFAAATHVGKIRDHNEDNYLIDKKLQLFSVADGMGGHASGEVASSLTVHAVRDAIAEQRDQIEAFQAGDEGIESGEILSVLDGALKEASRKVYEDAELDEGKRGMGTTSSTLLIAGPPGKLRGFIAHVGDSRIYLVRQGLTHQLTEDHSLLNELVKRKKITREEFATSPYKRFKNAVTRAVGIYPTVEVDTFDFDILPGDRFLLCSDGLSEYLENSTLPDMLADRDVETVTTSLINTANDGGGHDNITAIFVRISDGNTREETQRGSEMTRKIGVLKNMPFFKYLSYKELVRVMAITQTKKFKAGSSIFVEGQEGQSMFVVVHGSVRVHTKDHEVAKLSEGQHFGEMALVNRSPRSLSATAQEDCTVLSINRKDFYAIIKREPALSTKLLWSFVQALATRLRDTTKELNSKR